MCPLNRGRLNDSNRSDVLLNAVFKFAPNPCRDQVRVSYGAPVEGDFSIRLYDAIGRPVATLAKGHSNNRIHAFSFDTRGLPCGIYLLQFRTGTSTMSKKLVIARRS
jgi:hypothetical protein